MLTTVSHTIVFDDKVLTAISTACHRFNSAYMAYEYMLTAVNILYDKWLECDLAIFKRMLSKLVNLAFNTFLLHGLRLS